MIVGSIHSFPLIGMLNVLTFSFGWCSCFRFHYIKRWWCDDDDIVFSIMISCKFTHNIICHITPKTKNAFGINYIQSQCGEAITVTYVRTIYTWMGGKTERQAGKTKPVGILMHYCLSCHLSIRIYKCPMWYIPLFSRYATSSCCS